MNLALCLSFVFIDNVVCAFIYIYIFNRIMLCLVDKKI